MIAGGRSSRLRRIGAMIGGNRSFQASPETITIFTG